MTIDFSDGYQLLGAVIDRLEQLITIFKIQHKGQNSHSHQSRSKKNKILIN